MSGSADMSSRPSTPSDRDRAVREAMSRPLSPEELEGFGPAKREPPRVVPVVKILSPSKEDGPRGYGVFIGVKGTF